MNICSVRYSQMLEVQRAIRQTKARRESLSLNTTLGERGRGAAFNETGRDSLEEADNNRECWS